MIKINPLGGYITNWAVPDPATGNLREILYQGSSLKRTGIPPLFPCWGESGTQLRKHGFARDVLWNIILESSKKAIMTLDSRNIKELIWKEYPENFKAEIDAVAVDNKLVYRLKVHNRGKNEIAIAPALHPYFAVSHSDKKNIRTTGIPNFDTRSFDWDNNPPDNHYPFDKKAEIIFPGHSVGVSDISPAPVIKYIVIWSQPTKNQDKDFVCFEPITALSGAIGKKEILVKGDSTWEMKLEFTVSFD